MPSIQIRGPRLPPKGPVTYHTNFLRSQDLQSTEFMVSIKLGDKLRTPLLLPRTTNNNGNGAHAAQQSNTGGTTANGTSQKEAATLPKQEIHTNGQTTSLVAASETLRTTLHPTNKTATGLENITRATNTSSQDLDLSTVDPLLRGSDGKAELDSELEILEVREVTPPPTRPLETQEDSESELSQLDMELNNVLSSTTTVAGLTGAATQDAAAPCKHLPIHIILPSLYKEVKTAAGPVPPGYRSIPRNLVYPIQRELNLFQGGCNDDDDLEVVGRMTFSLKDPIARTKIKLPVKSTTCRHFECFDLYNFCLFYGLPPGVRVGLKQSLMIQSKEARETEDLFVKQQQRLAAGQLLFRDPGLVYPRFLEHGQVFFTDLYSKTPPLYKCPLCDEKFGLKQLYISDIFNFFVKTTPLDITRIEIMGNDRYRIIEDDILEHKEEDAEVVDLSSDGELEPETDLAVKAEPAAETSTEKESSKDDLGDGLLKNNSGEGPRSNSEDFDDGLDDVLLRISQGDGSWGNPVTLD